MSEEESQFDIEIEVLTNYRANESSPAENRYVFTYQISIHNHSLNSFKLLSRHWVITDGNQQVLEVSGEGVVGEQPLIEPGSSYEYTSGVVLETPLGTMEGSYEMVSGEGAIYQAQIPVFSLLAPGLIH